MPAFQLDTAHDLHEHKSRQTATASIIEAHRTTARDATSLEETEESVAGESQWERSGEVSIKIAEVSSRDS